MVWLSLLANAAFLFWVLCLGGAKTIEGSWLAAWEFRALTEGEIKFMAWIGLLILGIFVIRQVF